MSKYIDADALKRKFSYSDADTDDEKIWTATMRRMIDEMPAADVTSVIHGKLDYADWPSKTSNRFCSICGCSEKIYAYNKDEFKYCRQCGAKMDGGSE